MSQVLGPLEFFGMVSAILVAAGIILFVIEFVISFYELKREVELIKEKLPKNRSRRLK